jgi:hypothetical protein
MVFNATFNNISAMSWRLVLFLEEIRVIVRVCIVLKTRIGRDAAASPIQVFNTIRTSTIYFNTVHNTV